jgi:hypothetical protein
MILMEYSGARGTLIHEKKLKSKISCQTPFKCDLFFRNKLDNFSLPYTFNNTLSG